MSGEETTGGMLLILTRLYMRTDAKLRVVYEDECEGIGVLISSAFCPTSPMMMTASRIPRLALDMAQEPSQNRRPRPPVVAARRSTGESRLLTISNRAWRSEAGKYGLLSRTPWRTRKGEAAH